MSYWYLIPNHILLLSAFIFIGKQNKKIKYLEANIKHIEEYLKKK